MILNQSLKKGQWEKTTTNGKVTNSFGCHPRFPLVPLIGISAA
jgi:hypothetical protein